MEVFGTHEQTLCYKIPTIIFMFWFLFEVDLRGNDLSNFIFKSPEAGIFKFSIIWRKFNFALYVFTFFFLSFFGCKKLIKKQQTSNGWKISIEQTYAMYIYFISCWFFFDCLFIFAIDFGLSVKRLFNICGNKLNGNEIIFWLSHKISYQLASYECGEISSLQNYLMRSFIKSTRFTT